MSVKSKPILLDGESLKLADVYDLTKVDRSQVTIKDSTLKAVNKSNLFLNKTLTENKRIIYGINTGFGPMASHIMAKDQLLALQQNLIYSHAVGAGQAIEPKYILAAMVVRLNTLAKGYSGVSVELLVQLQKFINLRIIPLVPEHGAVGTSGDLVQLAHVGLALIGKGEVFYKGKNRDTAQVLKKLKIKPYKLKPKEGLSLINGTGVMAGISALLCQESQYILELCTRTGAMALELVQGFDDGISRLLHALRPHNGQQTIAQNLRAILVSSKLLKNRRAFERKFKNQEDIYKISQTVQEVYSLRCIPQILGPIFDTLQNTSHIIETEINSVTDNPIIDLDKQAYLHGGNFHGDYVASAVDQLKIALVKLTMLTERRINFFLNHNINKTFPPFLNLKKPGLTLGLQGLQFVATSTTAQSQTLGYPQYLHSIPTNADNQDIVSMGTDAALLTSHVLENLFIVASIELLTLAQAVDFLQVQNKLSNSSHKLYTDLRAIFPKITEDRVLTQNLAALLNALKEHKL